MIRRLGADQRGMALPVALAVLLILALLGTAAVLAATQTNDLTTRDANAKAALEAADAGLRVAAYRLNQLRPDDTHCPTLPVTAVGAGSLCAGSAAESIGNGASYRYWISATLSTGSCAGYAVDSTQTSIGQRCITAIGTANGVSARTQERAVAYNSSPVFPTAIFGTSSVTISNNATVAGTALNPALLATNGTLTVGGGGTTIDGYQVGPGATVNIDPQATNALPPSASLPAYRTAAWPALSNVPFGNTATVNNNSRICTLDPCTGGVTFNAATRVLSMSNNSSLTLGGGIYNFCAFTANNNAHITIGATVQTQIYIDSPSRILSDGVTPACANATSGSFTLSNNDALDNPSNNPLNVQLYVYGNPALPGANVVSLFNNTNSFISLDAPFSTINISPSNNTSYSGAIAGYAVTMGNAGHFTYVPSTSTLQIGSLGLYYRAYWAQCPATPTVATDPTSGC
jgi:Tfp pilus assembly protein PilX